MTKNISDALTRALSGDHSTEPIPLHVMFQREPSDAQWQQSVEQLQTLVPQSKVELLPKSRMALVQATLDQVPAIAEIPGVFWIDADKTAPLDAIKDSQ